MTKGKFNAQKNVKKKPRGKPFEVGNPWRIKPGEVRNPGGRPKLLSQAYREWLEAENEQGITNAALVALALGRSATTGDTTSAKELRQATEGDLIKDLSHMTDAELDDFIAQRERTEVSGVSGKRASPETKPADENKSPSV